VRSHNRTFEKSKCAKMWKKCEFSNVQVSQQAGLGNRPFWKCAISLFKEPKKCDSEIRTLFDIFSHSLFLKDWLCVCFLKCSFILFKRAIVGLYFFRTFEKGNKKCDRTIAHFKRATKSVTAQSHFWKERKCAMCECAIAQPCPQVVWQPAAGANLSYHQLIWVFFWL